MVSGRMECFTGLQMEICKFKAGKTSTDALHVNCHEMATLAVGSTGCSEGSHLRTV